jgi:hypothetical protein
VSFWKISVFGDKDLVSIANQFLLLASGITVMRAPS